MIRSARRGMLALFVAWRLVRSRRSPRLSAVTVISIVGVAVGVLSLTVVLGVTTGFQGAFQERILGLYPHLVVIKRAGDFREYPEVLEGIRNTQGVRAASPATYDDMMMAAGVHRSGAIVKGVELESVDDVIAVRDLMTDGDLDGLSETPRARFEGNRLHVDDVLAGTWLTVVVDGGASPRVLVDDRTPPDPGHARLAVLDLRGKERPAVPVLVSAGDQAADELARPLGPTRPGDLSDAVEVPGGTWSLDLTGDTLELDADTSVTLVLRPSSDADGPAVRAQVLVEPGRSHLAETEAMVRVVDVRSEGGALTLPGSADSGAPLVVNPGEHTGYLRRQARLPGVVLGRGLARRLSVEVGAEVTLVTPLRGIDNKMLGPYGMAPTSARHRVVGLFESGFHEYDIRLALVNVRAAQRFLNRGRVVRWIEVRTHDLLVLDDVKRRVASIVDPYDLETLARQTNGFEERMRRFMVGDVRGVELADPATFLGGLTNQLRLLNLVKYQEIDFGYRPRFRLIDWQEMNTNLLSALKLQKVVLTIFFLIIIVVGAFVVVGSQIMVIHEKTPDIAILKAMGATSASIRAVFTLQGLFVAGVGVLIGLVAGVAVCRGLAWIDWKLDASIYLIDHLPVVLSPMDLLLVAAATGVCTLATTQYSASRAAAMSVVEGLRAVD